MTSLDFNTSPRRDLAIAGCLVLALFAFYLATTSGHAPYGDESRYFNVARNILKMGVPMLGDLQQDAAGKAFLANARYCKYPLGQSLLEIPVLLLIEAFQVNSNLVYLILNALPALECALIAGLLFLAARLPWTRRGRPLLARRAAAMLAMATGVGTQLWPSASTHFADTSAAMLTFAAFYLVMRYRRGGAGEWALVAAAWAAGMAYFCKNTYLLTWPALGIYGARAVWRRREGGAGARAVRTALLSALPLALAVGGQLWFNHVRYGSIWEAGYREERDGTFGFNTPLLVGLHGMLFSPGCSLFVYSPLCVLAFFGWRPMARRMPAEVGLAAGIALPLVATYARWWSWYGGWEWGSRFLLFIVPLLMWLSAPAWKWLEKPRSFAVYRVRAALLAALLGAALFVQIAGVLIHPTAVWEISAGHLPVLEKSAWEKDVWEIRDDGVLNHFIPEFSPVAFNAWLAWATWNRGKLSEAELAGRAPSVKLNPQWVPREIGAYLGYDAWFWKEWTNPQGSRRLVTGILLILGLVSMAGLAGAFVISAPDADRSAVVPGLPRKPRDLEPRL